MSSSVGAAIRVRKLPPHLTRRGMYWLVSTVSSEASDAPTFERFYEGEFENVLRTAYLVIQDRAVAEEVAQEAFAKAYASWWRVSRYSFPGAWVRKVALRMAFRNVRRRRLHEKALETIDVQVAETRGLDLDLMRAIAQLSAAQRVAITLFYFEDLPIVEVADAMDCSESTVKVHLHRARQKLATLLGEEE